MKNKTLGHRKQVKYPFQEPDKSTFFNPWNNKVLMRYLNDLESWHKYIRFLGMPTTQEHKDVPAEKLFVSPRFANRYIKPSELEPNKEQDLFDLGQLLKKHPRAFVLGDPGSGKSTLVDWITTRFCKESEEVNALGPLIPFPMVLREMKLAEVETFDDLIDAFLEHDKCVILKKNRELVTGLLDIGQAFLLLDGLDEVTNPENRMRLNRALKNGFDGKWQYVRCLFTTRLIGFNQNDFNLISRDIVFEGKRHRDFFRPLESGIIRQKNEWVEVSEKALPEIYLSPFTNEQIGEFAHKWYGHAESNETRARRDADELKAAVHSNPNVLALSRTPNLLTLIALLHRISAILPADRHRLYQELTEAYLVKIEQTKRRKEASYRLEEHHQWLAVLGWEFQQRRGEEDEGVMMGFEEIQSILRIAMRATAGHEDATDESVEQYLDYVCRRSGILVPRSDKQYAFTHLSFQEYYAAQHLKFKLQTAQTEAIFGKSRKELDEFNRCLEEYFHYEMWWETLYLFFKSFETDKSALPHLFKKAFEREEVPGFIYIYYSDFKPYLKLDLEQKIKHASKLKLNYPQLQKLDFVELCHGLKVLDLNQTGVVDITSLSGFLGLERLYLENTGVYDLTPISGLTNLKALHLDSTSVSNIEPLKDLTSLRALYLDKTWVFDLSPLSDLTNLAWLSFNQTGVAHLNNLKGLVGLRGLDFSQTVISDLRPLSGLKNLEWLSFGQTRVVNLTPLSGLTRLERLYLEGTKVSKLTPVLGLKKLERLHISQTRVSDLSPIRALNELCGLDISQTKVKDITHLTNLTKLQELDLKQTGVYNLSSLSGLKNLQSLFLANTNVVDLSPLSGFQNLKHLSLTQTNVSDVSALSGLSGLKILELSQTLVSDLGPISNFSNLERLYLADTSVSNVSPLSGLLNLKSLDIAGTQVSDISMLPAKCHVLL